jgi:hypothetical protein
LRVTFGSGEFGQKARRAPRNGLGSGERRVGGPGRSAQWRSVPDARLDAYENHAISREIFTPLQSLQEICTCIKRRRQAKANKAIKLGAPQNLQPTADDPHTSHRLHARLFISD